jgi:hypothetical protein
MKKYWQLTIAITFLWIGFVCAISFMEAWLKFQAPGITLPLGLGIGRIVFQTLNKVEWAFAASILIALLLNKKTPLLNRLSFGVALCILTIQTFYLLPVLDIRASEIIAGNVLPPSQNHLYYIVIEFIKVLSLFIFGTSNFPKTEKIQ